MKIAFLGPAKPWRGGIAQFANNLGKKLYHHGHEVVSFSFIRQYPAWLFPGSDQLENNHGDDTLHTKMIMTPYNPLTWFTAIVAIKKCNPDIIIVSYWIPFMAPAYGFILRRLRSIKIIYLLHNVKFHEKWPFAEYLTRYALQPASNFISLSEITSNELNKLMPIFPQSKIIQLFHPVYEFKIKKSPILKMSSHRMLFFGFVKHYKGLDILLEALAIAVKELPDLHLTIAGDVYGVKKIYLDQIKKLDLQDRVKTVFEFIEEDKIADFFIKTDVCVLPYRSATQSGVTQMSFAFHVPVIATKTGGIEEIIKDGVNGLLVEPENPQELATAIVSYFKNEYMIIFQKNIAQQNERNSWDRFVDILMNSLS